VGTYALHRLAAFRDQGEVPGASRVFERAVALPFHTRLSESDLDRVAEALTSLVSKE
jgi:dTDP-4-amino-4,6-dideoxygalactose transaminase